MRSHEPDERSLILAELEQRRRQIADCPPASLERKASLRLRVDRLLDDLAALDRKR
jgi:hypothetical protein